MKKHVFEHRIKKKYLELIMVAPGLSIQIIYSENKRISSMHILYTVQTIRKLERKILFLETKTNFLETKNLFSDTASNFLETKNLFSETKTNFLETKNLFSETKTNFLDTTCFN
jgi:hypothetical protein